MKEKVLVTGGAGYVGSVLVPELLRNGYFVRVFDNLRYGGNSLLPYFRYKSFDFLKADIRDTEEVKKAVSDVDIIIHLAAIVGYPACQRWPNDAKTTNVDATRNMAKLVSKNQLVIYASTGSNYGAVPNGICTEETPLNPLSLYGKTKTEAENILMNECNTIAYRFATAFGLSPRMRLDLLINDFVYKALVQRYIVVYEADFMRTFIHVYDMARSFLFAIMHRDKMVNNVYNVGSEGMNCSKRNICKMIQKKIDYYLHIADIGEDADKRNYIVSYKKIASLGFDTTISIEEGIDELIRGLQALEIKEPYSNV